MEEEFEEFIDSSMSEDESYSSSESESESEEDLDPIFSLIDEDNIPAVKELLTADRTAIYRRCGEQQHSPLHHAATDYEESQANLKMVKLLLSHGALVNCRDTEFLTPLHIACMMGREKMCNLLLTNGARYYPTTDDGSLDPPYEAGESKVAEVLIRHGVKVSEEMGLPLSSSLQSELFGKPGSHKQPRSLKQLSRDVLRKTMRIITGGRTIQPLVASLENSAELDQDSGNFLVCDPSGDWRKKLASNLVKLEVKTGAAVGIVMGDSSVCVAVFRNNKVEIIPNDLGDKTIPAYVAYSDHPTRSYCKIVSKMWGMAEAHLDSLVRDAVLTVPADFDVSLKLAIREAGMLAGLNVVGILQEPVAVAIAFGLDKKESVGNILTLDFRCGSQTVSILGLETNTLTVKSSVVSEIEVNNGDFVRMLEREIKGSQGNLDGLDNAISDIIIVGEYMFLLSYFSSVIQNLFPGSELHTSINPEEMKATGAAIMAARLTGEEMEREEDKSLSEGDGGTVSVTERAEEMVGPSLSKKKKLE